MRTDGDQLDPNGRRRPQASRSPGANTGDAPERSVGHDEQHERWMLTALELEPGDPAQARRSAEGCAQCADELQRFDELRQLLDDAGASQNETLEQVRRAMRAGESAPGEELVAPLLRAKLEPLAPRRSKLRLVAPLATAAAAAAVLLGWLMRSWLPLDDDHGRGVMLGEHTDNGLSPAGEVREYAPFRWPMKLPPGGSFSLRVWDARGDDPRKAIYSRARIEENEHWIEPATLAVFPDEIGWDVQAFDATGQDVGAPHKAYATRSR